MVTTAYAEAYCPHCGRATRIHAETGRCQECGRATPGARDPRVLPQPGALNGAAAGPAPQVLLLPDSAATRRWVGETRRFVDTLADQSASAHARLEEAQQKSASIDRVLSAVRGLLKQIDLPAAPQNPAATHGTARWARDHDACVVCGKTERAHAANGVCKRCYDKRRGK